MIEWLRFKEIYWQSTLENLKDLNPDKKNIVGNNSKPTKKINTRRYILDEMYRIQTCKLICKYAYLSLVNLFKLQTSCKL